MEKLQERAWDTDRAIRVALMEFYMDAHESWANIDCQRWVEGRSRHIGLSNTRQSDISRKTV